MMRFADKPVYLACGRTDMRKSINGLAMAVKVEMKLRRINIMERNIAV